MRLIKNFKKYKIVSFSIFVLGILFFNSSEAAVLLPGNISTCGELATAGTYTLTTDVDGGGDTCFTVSSNGVVISGGSGSGYTISGTGSVAIDARTRDAGPGSSLTDGADSYTNLQINNITISGYDSGINVSGNDSTSTFAGDAGAVEIFYSIVGSITADGGDTTAKAYGGSGGSVSFTDTDLDISDSDFSTLGGTGTTGSYTNGGIDLDYSGDITNDSATFSKMSFFYINDDEYTNYPGGTWPVAAGNISSCGTLAESGTYTLTSGITATSTCFYIAASNVSIDFDTYEVNQADASSTNPMIEAEYGDYGTTTLVDLTDTDFIKLVNSDEYVRINNSGDLDISSLDIEAGSLTIDYGGTFTYTGTTISALNPLIIDGINYGSVSAGTLSSIISGDGWIQRTSAGDKLWASVDSNLDGSVIVAAASSNDYLYISEDGGATWTPNTALGRKDYLLNQSGFLKTKISEDGTKVFAMTREHFGLGSYDDNGYIYFSEDGGDTWSKTGESDNWNMIGISADGEKLFAGSQSSGGGQNNDHLRYSDSGGNSLGELGETGNFGGGIAVSSRGDVIYLDGLGSSYLYKSEDGGETWSISGDSERDNWNAMTTSKDGTVAISTSDVEAKLFLSTDGGSNWNYLDDPGEAVWQDVDMSADGSVIVAAATSNDYVYVSTDSGANWTQQTDLGEKDWSAVSVSADGNSYQAVSSNDYIYTYSNPSPTLRVDVLSPGTATTTKWNPIVSWGTSQTCEYSYDNSNWTTVDCDNNGNDIEAPDYGTGTLYVRGEDADSNTDSDSVSYNYQIGPLISSLARNIKYNSSSFNPSIVWDRDNLTGGLYTDWTCSYSYDNFSTTNVVDCSNLGSDIELPDSSGTTTLSVKVDDGDGNVGTDSVTVLYDDWVAIDSISNRHSNALYSFLDGNLVTNIYNGTGITDLGYSTWYYLSDSSDFGKTWEIDEGDEFTGSLSGFARSYDNSKQYHLTSTSIQLIQYSDDSGETFTSLGREIKDFFGTIDASGEVIFGKSSSDGTKTLLSYDSGQNWSNIYTFDGGSWQSSGMDISDDGKVIILSDFNSNSDHFISTDGGKNFEDLGAIFDDANVISEFDITQNGERIYATEEDRAYVSTDYGQNWLDISPPTISGDILELGASFDGEVVAIINDENDFYLSTNSGSSWTATENIGGTSPSMMTVSKDGTKIYAASASDNELLFYSDPDLTLRVGILNPGTATTTKWNPIVSWGTSQTCEYSYDNSNWTTVDCDNNGNDIEAPDYGTGTLYVRGEDADSNTDTYSVNYNYLIGPQINSPGLNVDYTGANFNPSIVWDRDNLTSGSYTDWTCSYSYDNFSTTNVVDCSNLGSDIELPDSSGTTTLSVKVDDGDGNVGTDSTTFNYVVWQALSLASDPPVFRDIWTNFDASTFLGGDNDATLQISQNYGNAWEDLKEDFADYENRLFRLLASHDYKNIFAVVPGIPKSFFYSNNYGESWSEGTDAYYYDIASSVDGKHVYLATSNQLSSSGINGYLLKSSDYGQSFTSYTSFSRDRWYKISSSSNGKYAVAILNKFEYIYTTDDYGETWTQRTSSGSKRWKDVSMSNDGSIIYAITNSESSTSGYLYTSDDYGSTWTQNTNLGLGTWQGVGTSGDGSVIYAGRQSATGYLSKDSGATWSEEEDGGTNISSVEISSDGNTILNSNSGYNYYLYTNPDQNFFIDILLPGDGDVSSWNPVVSWSISETCEYSWDNSNWVEVECSNKGSDIPRPDFGTSTLYIRGEDADSNTETSSQEFNYYPYYWCGTEDNDWNNGDNWYSDDDCEVADQLSAVPDDTVDTILSGSVAPIIDENTSELPANIDSTELTGSASSTGVIFTDDVENTTTITGNATFRNTSINDSIITGNVTFEDSAYNNGTITGNVVLDEMLGGIFTLTGSMKWAGSISGTITGSDDEEIDYDEMIFEDSSTNEITITGSPTFYDSSSNNGTIVGNPTFNNSSSFRIGTVTGTANLSNSTQIIIGSNSVTNFTKQLTSGTATLWFDPSAILNVSSLFTLKGYNSNNFLNIRSLTPGDSYDLGINGTADFDYLRLADANNTGSTLSLVDKTVIDAGGNTGFTFPDNSNSGSYTFVETPPVLPVSRGGEDSSSGSSEGSSSSSSSGSGGLFYAVPGALDFNPTQEFNPFGDSEFNPGQAGATIVPNPFENFQAPGAIEFVDLPVNFRLRLEEFIFEPAPQEISSIPGLNNIAGVSFSSAQKIASLLTSSKSLGDIDLETQELVFAVFNSKGSQINTKLKYENGGLIQTVRAYPSTDLIIKINAGDKDDAEFIYQGVSINSNQEGPNIYSVSVNTQGPGVYTINSNITSIEFVIEVVSPPDTQEVKKPWGIFNWLYNLLT